MPATTVPTEGEVLQLYKKLSLKKPISGVQILVHFKYERFNLFGYGTSNDLNTGTLTLIVKKLC
jgi:hypothetical protein